jgi:hypothetical protein
MLSRRALRRSAKRLKQGSLTNVASKFGATDIDNRSAERSFRNENWIFTIHHFLLYEYACSDMLMRGYATQHLGTDCLWQGLQLP